MDYSRLPFLVIWILAALQHSAGQDARKHETEGSTTQAPLTTVVNTTRWKTASPEPDEPSLRRYKPRGNTYYPRKQKENRPQQMPSMHYVPQEPYMAQPSIPMAQPSIPMPQPSMPMPSMPMPSMPMPSMPVPMSTQMNMNFELPEPAPVQPAPSLFKSVAAPASSLFGSLGSIFSGLFPNLLNAGSTIGNLLQGGMSLLSKLPLGKIFNGITSFFTNFLPKIFDFGRNLMNCISTLLPAFWEIVKSVFKFIPRLIAYIPHFLKIISSILRKIPHLFQRLLRFVGSFIYFLRNLWHMFRYMIKRVLYTIGHIITLPLKIFTHIIPSAVYNALEFIFGPIKMIKKLIRGVWNHVLTPPFRAVRTVLQEILYHFVVYPIKLIHKLVRGFFYHILLGPIRAVWALIRTLLGKQPYPSSVSLSTALMPTSPLLSSLGYPSMFGPSRMLRPLGLTSHGSSSSSLPKLLSPISSFLSNPFMPSSSGGASDMSALLKQLLPSSLLSQSTSSSLSNLFMPPSSSVGESGMSIFLNKLLPPSLSQGNIGIFSNSGSVAYPQQIQHSDVVTPSLSDIFRLMKTFITTGNPVLCTEVL